MLKWTFPVFLIYVTCTESYLKTVNILKHSYKMMSHFQLLEYYAPQPPHSCCHIIKVFHDATNQTVSRYSLSGCDNEYSVYWHFKEICCLHLLLNTERLHNVTSTVTIIWWHRTTQTSELLEYKIFSTLCFVSLFIPKNSFKYTLVIMNQITFFNNLWGTDDVCNLVWVKKSVMLQFQVKVTIFREKHGSWISILIMIHGFLNGTAGTSSSKRQNSEIIMPWNW